MLDQNPTLPVITLNANGLDTKIKKIKCEAKQQQRPN